MFPYLFLLKWKVRADVFMELAWIMHCRCFGMSAIYVEDLHLVIVLQVLNPRHAGMLLLHAHGRLPPRIIL